MQSDLGSPGSLWATSWVGWAHLCSRWVPTAKYPIWARSGLDRPLCNPFLQSLAPYTIRLLPNEYFILSVFPCITGDYHCVGLYILTTSSKYYPTKLRTYQIDGSVGEFHRSRHGFPYQVLCWHCVIRNIANTGRHPTLKAAECTSDTLDRSDRPYISHRIRCSEVSVGQSATVRTAYVPLRGNLGRKTTQPYGHNLRMA